MWLTPEKETTPSVCSCQPPCITPSWIEKNKQINKHQNPPRILFDSYFNLLNSHLLGAFYILAREFQSFQLIDN